MNKNNRLYKYTKKAFKEGIAWALAQGGVIEPKQTLLETLTERWEETKRECPNLFPEYSLEAKKNYGNKKRKN